MSRFELVPLDGGAPVHLSPGETRLGRGPLLGISDKRVSRHHAVLDVTSKQLRVKSTHVNPCFLQSSLDDDPRPLDQDSWVCLSPGDFLSLLPGRFVYQLATVGGDTLRDVPSSDEDPSGSERGQKPEGGRGADEEHRSDTTSGQSDESGTALMSPQGGALSRPPRHVGQKRVLPAWMMKSVSPQTSSPKAVKKRKEPAAVVQKVTPTVQPVEAGLSEEEEEEEEERPRKKRRKSDERNASEKVRSKSIQHDEEASKGGDDVTMKEEEGWAMVIDRRTSPGTSNGAAQVPTSKAAAASATRLRAPCPFGSSCYRKNPAHFQESSHPGDSDFEEEAVDESQLPECPYGTECYRKNPLHRKEFRHSRRPARSTRTAGNKPEEDEEDDEYESSFIDDSDDGDGDSDYVPAEDEDDVKRLQREARDFLKKRK